MMRRWSGSCGLRESGSGYQGSIFSCVGRASVGAGLLLAGSRRANVPVCPPHSSQGVRMRAGVRFRYARDVDTLFAEVSAGDGRAVG